MVTRFDKLLCLSRNGNRFYWVHVRAKLAKTSPKEAANAGDREGWRQGVGDGGVVLAKKVSLR